MWKEQPEQALSAGLFLSQPRFHPDPLSLSQSHELTEFGPLSLPPWDAGTILCHTLIPKGRKQEINLIKLAAI